MIQRSSVRSTPDTFASYAQNWNWATSAQIDALLGKSSEGGINLDQVLGERFSTIGQGGPRWLGYHSLETQPDGWIVQSNNTPGFDEVTFTGFQNGAAAMTPGAWLISAADPVAQDRLWNAGPAGEYFYDATTDLYWQDPENFAEQSRAEIQSWLDINPDWRWAAQAEVYALQGIHSYDDVPLEEIMGTAQYGGAGGKRWIGFYDQLGQPDGLILGTFSIVNNALVVQAGTQGGAEGWGAGAWILTESRPTAVPSDNLGDADWGALKVLYR